MFNSIEIDVYIHHLAKNAWLDLTMEDDNSDFSDDSIDSKFNVLYLYV